MCDKQLLRRVVLIGSGNVAEAYARTLPAVEGVELVQIYARNEVRGRELAALANVPWCSMPEGLAAADLYIIAVSDRAIADVSAELSFCDDAFVVHTAGSVAMDAIAEREGRRGVLYAFQSFTSGRDICFADIPIFVEADNEVVEGHLREFASRLSSKVYVASSERRRMVHLTGVIVNNFTNHLYTLGGELLHFLRRYRRGAQTQLFPGVGNDCADGFRMAAGNFLRLLDDCQQKLLHAGRIRLFRLKVQ